MDNFVVRRGMLQSNVGAIAVDDQGLGLFGKLSAAGFESCHQDGDRQQDTVRSP
jgi:hypothetical protein